MNSSAFGREAHDEKRQILGLSNRLPTCLQKIFNLKLGLTLNYQPLSVLKWRDYQVNDGTVINATEVSYSQGIKLKNLQLE